MRKNIYLLLTALLVLFMNACSPIEEIYLNKDGSGEYMVYTDMIPMMTEMMSFGSMMGEEEDPSDSLSLEDKIWRDFPSESIDSTERLSNMMPDSMMEDPELKAMYEKMFFFMEGGREEGYVNMGIKFDFKNISELGEMQKLAQKNQSMMGGGALGEGGGGSDMPDMDTGEMEVDYKWAKKNFSRTTTYTRKPELDSETEMGLRMFMNDATMTTIIHLPKKVKKATGENVVKVDGNKVILEYDVMESMKGNVNTDFQVKYK